MSVRKPSATERQAAAYQDAARARRAVERAARADAVRRAEKRQQDADDVDRLGHRAGTSSATILQAAHLLGQDEPEDD